MKLIDILSKYTDEEVLLDKEIEDLAIDSLDLVKSIIDVENTFNIKYDVDLLMPDNFIYVNDILDSIIEQLKRNNVVVEVN